MQGIYRSWGADLLHRVGKGCVEEASRSAVRAACGKDETTVRWLFYILDKWCYAMGRFPDRTIWEPGAIRGDIRTRTNNRLPGCGTRHEDVGGEDAGIGAQRGDVKMTDA